MTVESLFAAEARLRSAAVRYAFCDAMAADGEPADRVRSARDAAREKLRLAARTYAQAVLDLEATR